MAKPNRGDTQALPGYFFPNHSSLFTKKPSPFHMGLYFGKVPTVNPSVKNQRFLPAPFGKGASGVPPVAMRTVIFSKSLLPLQSPVSLPGGNRGSAPKPPWSLWGWFGEAKPGGFRRQSLGTFYLITLHYSLKSLPFSTLGCAFKKVPTVNPSVTAAPCQLPLAREPRRAAAVNFAR